MTFRRRVRPRRRDRNLCFVLVAGLLIVVAAACGEGDTSAKSRSPQTSIGTGSNGPGLTTHADTTGSSPTLAPAPTFPPGETGATGIVGRNPCPTGGQRACDARLEPLAATVVVIDPRSGDELTRAESPANGRYAIRLAAGDYRLEANPDATDLSCAPLDIVVPDASSVEANIECQ